MEKRGRLPKEWLTHGPRAEDVDVLREYVERYPYAGPLRMLLAKASDAAQDLERRDDLLRAGAHVSSRRALFAYLVGPSLVEQAREIQAEIDQLPAVSEEELVDMVWHAQDEHAGTDDVDVAAEPASSGDAVEDAMPREAMVSAIASVLDAEIQNWTKEADEIDSESEASQAVPTLEVKEGAQPTSLFARWLSQRAKETGFGSPELAEKGASALIDAFLAKGDVKIGPVRDSDASTGEWAMRGLVEDPSMVTETMAKLYAQQGQMSRARKAYRLLALKYPEKSVYFAAQLKKLRNS